MLFVWAREIGASLEKTDVNGAAIALGHSRRTGCEDIVIRFPGAGHRPDRCG